MYERTVRSEIERRLSKAEQDYKAYADKFRSLPMGSEGTQEHVDYLIAWVFAERCAERCHAFSEALEVIDTFDAEEDDTDCFLPDDDGGP
jgi:hypothetical protein